MSAPTPPKKVKKSQIEERVEFAYRLLARRYPNGKIKDYLRRKYGPLGHATCERYLSRARERLRQVLGATRPELRCEAAAFYLAFAGDAKLDPETRLRAQQHFDKLVGLPVHLPPVEALCEYLGCTPEQLAVAVALATGRPVPGAEPAGAAAPPGPGPEPLPG